MMNDAATLGAPAEPCCKTLSIVSRAFGYRVRMDIFIISMFRLGEGSVLQLTARLKNAYLHAYSLVTGHREWPK
jgi:hypothetical protein